MYAMTIAETIDARELYVQTVLGQLWVNEVGKGEGKAIVVFVAIANAFTDVLDHCGLDRAIVGGTSWGGLAAAELALMQPQRVAVLILMNTPFQIDGQRSRLIALGTRWMLHRRLFRNGVAKSFFNRVTS